jgi:hypothetical protein
MKTLVRMAGVVIVALSALLGTGCNVQWSGSGSLTVDAPCRPVEVAYRPAVIRTVEIQPVVIEHCRPAPRISCWLRR